MMRNGSVLEPRSVVDGACTHRQGRCGGKAQRRRVSAPVAAPSSAATKAANAKLGTSYHICTRISIGVGVTGINVPVALGRTRSLVSGPPRCVGAADSGGASWTGDSDCSTSGSKEMAGCPVTLSGALRCR
jgi:hypothetical protein